MKFSGIKTVNNEKFDSSQYGKFKFDLSRWNYVENKWDIVETVDNDDNGNISFNSIDINTIDNSEDKYVHYDGSDGWAFFKITEK